MPVHTLRHSVTSSAPVIHHERAVYTVKGEDRSRTCSIELSEGVVVKFFAVFDGHGGPRAAQWAAEHLPQLIAKHFAATDAHEQRALRLQAACRASFISLDNQIARDQSWHDGTTATCVIIDGNDITVANVGDSAAVLFCPGSKPVTLSADHRVSRRSPTEHGRIVDAGAQIGRIKGRDGLPVGPERIYPGGLCVTRSIGDHDSTKAAIPEPDVVTVTLPPRGGTIVLASDGVWDFTDSATLERLIETSRKPKCGIEWLSKTLMRTVCQANTSIDDATLFCIDLKKPGSQSDGGKSASPLSMGAKVKKMFGIRSKSPQESASESDPSSGTDNDSIVQLSRRNSPVTK